MAVIKVIRNTYGGVEYIQNACQYIHNSKYMKCCSGFGVCANDYMKAAAEMILVRRFFHKESGNPLFHIVIAFDDTIKDEELAWSYLVTIASFFAPTNQVYFAMHGKDENCPHLHGHLVVNSVSYVNGKMFNTDEEIPVFKHIVEETIGQKCKMAYADKKDQKKS